ncbi:MAG TPA: hypothetical protein VGF07_05760 [Stellaceae bacterium]|jgi:hypothetical protein
MNIAAGITARIDDDGYGRFEFLHGAAKFTTDANLLERQLQRRVARAPDAATAG